MTNEQAFENVGANMKITKVESVAVDRFLFAKIYTDEGIVGYGESGAWGFWSLLRLLSISLANI